MWNKEMSSLKRLVNSMNLGFTDHGLYTDIKNVRRGASGYCRDVLQENYKLCNVNLMTSFFLCI